jgi:hypothetical protein
MRLEDLSPRVAFFRGRGILGGSTFFLEVSYTRGGKIIFDDGKSRGR